MLLIAVGSKCLSNGLMTAPQPMMLRGARQRDSGQGDGAGDELARCPPPPSLRQRRPRNNRQWGWPKHRFNGQQRNGGNWYMWTGCPSNCGRGANVGGIGIFSQADSTSPEIRISEPLPMNVRQTNNAPELWEGLQFLQRVPGQRLAIVSGSEYLILGLQGKVQQWQNAAWVGGGGGGGISNIAVWEELLVTGQRTAVDLCAGTCGNGRQ